MSQELLISNVKEDKLSPTHPQVNQNSTSMYTRRALRSNVKEFV
jgi:hypothetical protein